MRWLLLRWFRWWTPLDDAWTSGPLLMKESLIDGLVLPFSKWRPSTSLERMPVLALGSVKRLKAGQQWQKGWLEEIFQLWSQLEKRVQLLEERKLHRSWSMWTTTLDQVDLWQSKERVDIKKYMKKVPWERHMGKLNGVDEPQWDKLRLEGLCLLLEAAFDNHPMKVGRSSLMPRGTRSESHRLASWGFECFPQETAGGSVV